MDSINFDDFNPAFAKPARPAGGAKEGKGGKPVKKEPAEEVAPDDIPF